MSRTLLFLKLYVISHAILEHTNQKNMHRLYETKTRALNILSCNCTPEPPDYTTVTHMPMRDTAGTHTQYRAVTGHGCSQGLLLRCSWPTPAEE